MYDIIKTAKEWGNIKTCPFCGNDEHIMIRHNITTSVDQYGDKNPDWWEIECYKCHCTMKHDTANDVITRWNSRKIKD